MVVRVGSVSTRLALHGIVSVVCCADYTGPYIVGRGRVTTLGHSGKGEGYLDKGGKCGPAII